MRISHIILLVVAIIGCITCYAVGFRAGTQLSPSKKDEQGRLVMVLHTYRAAELTNWPAVHSSLRIQLLAITRSYERRFGDETGTNRFASQFADAKVFADQIESHLVPVSSILTNLPHTPDVKVTVGGDK